MSRCAILFAVCLIAVTVRITTSSNAELLRIFTTVLDTKCKDGFVTIKEQDCIVKCINETDFQDVVEPYVLREQFYIKGCCKRTTYVNQDYECTVENCQNTTNCPYESFLRPSKRRQHKPTTG